MTDPADIEISTRPFMGDLLGSVSTGQGTVPVARGQENPHLVAAVTGRPALHLVGDDDTVSEVESRKSRNRQRPSDDASGTVLEPAPENDFLDVDWDTVKTLTQQLNVTEASTGRTRAEFDVAKASPKPETDGEQRTLEDIHRVVQRHTTLKEYEWTGLARAHYVQAVFDQAFRYGRLQQYLRRPDTEDVSIVGPGNVLGFKVDGRVERLPAICRTEGELQLLIANVATWRGRTFRIPSGTVDVDMGGARMSATGLGPTSESNATIRLHNLLDIDLSGMTERLTITKPVEAFLAAAAAANCCILVSGIPGTGKTTLVRALMSGVKPWEKIVTIETERELYLKKLPERHWQVMDLQYMPPEYATGDSKEGLTLARCLELAVRAKSERILFAEMLSHVAPVAMAAMDAGKGSVSTIHAGSAQAAITQFAKYLMYEGHLVDDSVPLKQIASTVDLIVQLDFIDNADGSRRRVVTEVTEVQASPGTGDPIAARLFHLNSDTGQYVSPDNPKSELATRLRRAGYDWNSQRAARP